MGHHPHQQKDSSNCVVRLLRYLSQWQNQGQYIPTNSTKGVITYLDDMMVIINRTWSWVRAEEQSKMVSKLTFWFTTQSLINKWTCLPKMNVELHQMCVRWVKAWYLMLQNRCKTAYNTRARTKCMNCIVAVVIAILALVIHVANNFFEERVKICPRMSSRCLLTKQRHRFRLNNRRIK